MKIVLCCVVKRELLQGNLVEGISGKVNSALFAKEAREASQTVHVPAVRSVRIDAM